MSIYSCKALPLRSSARILGNGIEMRGFKAWLRAGSIVGLMLFAFLVFGWRTLWPARFSEAYGFPLYYTAGRLFVEGGWGPLAYDDQWFGDQVESFTRNGVREIYAPSPPMAPLLFAVFAKLDLARAREVWTWTNFLMLLIAFWLISNALIRFEGTFWRVALLIMALLAAPVHEHFRLGQLYIFLLLFFSLGFWLVHRRYDLAAGITLAIPFAMKVSGVPLLFTLFARHQRRLSVSALSAAGIMGLCGFVIMGMPTWLAFLQSFAGRLTNYPAIAATAFQSTSGFLHHLFVQDQQWNPHPLWAQPWLATLLTWASFIAALASTMRRAPQSDPALAFAAGLTLSVVLLPLAEEYHYVLMLLPIGVMLAYSLHGPCLPPDFWCLTAVVFLIGCPLPYRAPHLSSGWIVLFAYPRLYGGWIAWWWLMRRMKLCR